MPAAITGAQALQQELRSALGALSVRGLKRSATWCAELLQGLAGQNLPQPPPQGGAELVVSDRYLIAKAFFDNHEFQRAARVLQDSDAAALPAGGALDAFLWAYSLFLAGERRKEEALREGDQAAANEHLDRLLLALPERGQDGYLLWLRGVCLKERGGRDADARAALLQACAQSPWNWSAWLDLAGLCGDLEVYGQLRLPDEQHLAARLFRGHVHIEHQAFDEAAELHQALRPDLGRSSFVLGQLAVALYGASEFEAALKVFAELDALDPFRLTNADTLSNLYFVKEARAELSHLAHRAVRIDKFRAETCCVVGNYYSIKGQHEHAVTYFKRALKQNRRYLSALTLLGHEFVELKNLPAAIEAYRSAVDVNPRDFRAWYGLGQAYEIARMHYYSLHYYRKTTSLRPADARMWCALGGCYEKVALVHEAVKCYKRADDLADREGIAAQRLAQVYKKLGDADNAVVYFHKHLTRRQEEGNLFGPDVVEALRYVAVFLRDRNRLDQALRFAERLQRVVGPGDREADALLREIQAMRGAHA